jgi:hypothetical protein
MASPIAMLPNEILSLIFQYYVGMKLPVWHLVQVSRKWEDIAFSTPSLWSSILVLNNRLANSRVEEFMHGSEPEYYYEPEGSRQACFEPSHISKAISRSGACLLDIDIRLDVMSSQEAAFLDFTLDMLMKPSISARIECLELYIELSSCITMKPQYFFHMPLPNLRRVFISEIPKEWYQHLLQSIAASANNLEMVRCLLDDLDNSLPDHIWEKLIYIQLENDISSEKMDELVSKLIRTENFAPLPMNWPSSITPQATFPRLRRASLSCTPFYLGNIQWPSLERLAITDFAQPAGLGDNDATLKQSPFPMLRTFEVATYRPLVWLSNIIAPNLTELRIIWEPNPQSNVPTHVPARNLPGIKTLHLDTGFPDEVTVPLLEIIPNVVSVAIVSTSGSGLFGVGLLKSLMRLEKGSYMYPNLQYLRLGSVYDRVQTPKSMLEPEIKRMVRMRKSLDFAFSIDVHWSTRDVVQHYGPGKRR